MKTLDIFRGNIRKARLGLDLTQQALSELGGFSYKYYQSLEAGRITGFTFATVERLAVALKVEPWKLFHPSAISEPERERSRSRKIQR